jgi:hypothetical protein
MKKQTKKVKIKVEKEIPFEINTYIIGDKKDYYKFIDNRFKDLETKKFPIGERSFCKECLSRIKKELKKV